jgi:hypothetical protein
MRLANANAASPHSPISDLPAAQLTDAYKGIAWWNNLEVGQRRYWLLVTKGGSVAECWAAYNAHLCKPSTVKKLVEILTGQGWLRCFEVREDCQHLVKLYTLEGARKYARYMRAHRENRGRVYTIHEVRP